MKKMLLLFMICLLLPELSFAAQGASELLIRRAPVPAEPPYQGEVRLLRRGSAQVVQTLLRTKVMNHVIAAIQKKELRDWPQEREGSADSRRYTEELVQAYHAVRIRAKDRQDVGDRHLQLMIEFVKEEERCYVALYAPTLTQEGDRLVPQKKELLKKLPLSGNYVQKNMQLILQDSFKLNAGKAKELLQQAAGN